MCLNLREYIYDIPARSQTQQASGSTLPNIFLVISLAAKEKKVKEIKGKTNGELWDMLKKWKEYENNSIKNHGKTAMIQVIKSLEKRWLADRKLCLADCRPGGMCAAGCRAGNRRSGQQMSRQ